MDQTKASDSASYAASPDRRGCCNELHWQGFKQMNALKPCPAECLHSLFNFPARANPACRSAATADAAGHVSHLDGEFGYKFGCQSGPVDKIPS